MKKKSNEVAEKMGSSNMEAVRILKEQFDHEDTAYKKAFQEQQYAENQYFSSHIENLPLLFMKPAIEFSIKIVDDLRKKGELPYGAKDRKSTRLNSSH